MSGGLIIMAGTYWKMACASAALSVAGCGPKAPPQVVAPPPPRAVPPAPVARPMPLPPASAAPNLTIPGADAAGNRLFVTGKWWPTLFEIRVRPGARR